MSILGRVSFPRRQHLNRSKITLAVETAGLAAVTITISVLSLISGPAASRAIIGNDKLSHMAGYAALGFFAFFVIRKLFYVKRIGDIRSGLLALLYSTALGGILELLQQYTGRQPEIADLLADVGGSLIGIIIAWITSSAAIMISRNSRQNH